MRRLSIDCSGVRTPTQFWDAYLREVEPVVGGFGRNLDAFADALEGGPGFPGECELSLLNSAELHELDDGRFLQHLREIAAELTSEVVTVVFR